MAAGRHGGYRDREADFVMSRKVISYTNGENERFRKASRDYVRVKSGRESLVNRGRVRQEDIKERIVSDVGRRSTSSRSDSGSSGESRRSVGLVLPADREPGELSSDGSDVAINSESQVGMMLENGNQSSPSNKKRKFSPIVWDRDDKKVSRTIESKEVLETADLVSTSPHLADSPKPSFVPDDVEQASLVEDSDARVSKISSSDYELPADLSELPDESSHLPQELNWENLQQVGAINDEDYAPRTIMSSRWADAASPADEGEISDYEDKLKLRRRSGSESAEARADLKSNIPRGSRSDERGRSSSSDSYHENDGNNDDYMQIDGNQSYDDTNISCSESDDDIREQSDPPLRSFNMLQGCRSVDEFERLNKIDEGTYGIVFRAKDKKTGEIVALKKVKMKNEREGFPLTSLREINILLSIDHPSIVDVKEVVVGNDLDNIFMVMEYMEHDLKGLMETMRQPFSQSEVKCLMLQLLGGIKYLHDNWVLHRDLKTSNLLLNNRGELKICDFGLARQYGSPLKPYTQLVVTLWYRAPELLLGAKQYSTAIDMWSLGCIMAELLSKEPLFNGKSEVEQLHKIFKILGTPNDTIWPGLSMLPGAKANFVKNKYNLLRKKFPATSFTGSPVLSDAGFDLLNKLLTYDPDKRISAEAALNHEWFREVPLPKSKEFMPTFPAQHAQDRRMRRVMKSPNPLEKQRIEMQQGELAIGGLFGQ